MAGRLSLSALLAAVAIGIGLHAALAAPAFAQGRRAPHPGDVPTFVFPERAAAPRTVEPPPALPPEALDVTPSIFAVHAGTEGSPAAVQTVTRTVDRVLVEMPGNIEWLFVRNPTDIRRVSAMWTDHATKTIVVYEESDLRRTMGIRGWLDVITLGTDASSRSALAASPVVTVRQHQEDVDLSRLASPATRFPGYRQFDFADWLEGLHEH